MVSDTNQSPNRTVDRPAADESGSSTVINAAIGAAVGIVLLFVPFSTLLGGAIAGYLEGGEPGDGLRVGAIAGAFMLVPMMLVGLFFMLFFIGFGAGAPLMLGVMATGMLLFGALYIVGLSAAGGYLGIYLEDEL
ncbi:DUF5518 domain-containing protein [Natrinema salaciae]|uniref:DUF5518 domain-containing protein n=1 Tax=Natrinema salaciae TaxID=1186196 RepID=A0A1H9R793_9EURY|nr:DUF5518 domain-containing protein [Natrinema salaciae]SER68560.1 hypothetical protein SAMN04489841_4301 [Natrinema salaciae]